MAPEGGPASELVPACAKPPDADSCPHAHPRETTEALDG